MTPKQTASKEDPPTPRLSRKPSANTSTNGVENPIDPDAPREGRLASLKTRSNTTVKPNATKIAFKPKIVQRRKKDGASQSLLFNQDEGDEGPSDAHIRRVERGRGRGRGRGAGRVEAPLVASGPFAQGPAQGPAAVGRGSSSRNTGGGRVATQSQPGRSTTSTKSAKRSKEDIEHEANLDDSGQPMRNLLRMNHDTSDFWAPITTARIERAVKDTPIAQPEAGTKSVKVKKEAEDLGFIDVKTEPTESTITSRMPSPDAGPARALDHVMQDADESRSQTVQAGSDADDDMDIALPGLSLKPVEKPVESKLKVEKEKKKPTVRVLSAEEAEEQDREFADIASLRLSFNEESDPSHAEGEQMYFIQLPDVLPLWTPGPEDGNDDGFIKEEEQKDDIVEIDQKAEDVQKFKNEHVEPDLQEKSTKNEGPGSGSRTSTKVEIQTTADLKSGPSNATPSSTTPGDDKKPPTEELPKRKKKKQKPVPFPPPEGLLGQMHVHRSGRISCTWGGITFDVGAGSECGFLQEVVVVDHKTDKKAWSLGRVNSRIIMTPNLDELLGSRG